MDTKSKNIKYSYGTKVFVFFLVIALVVSAGVLLASDVDMIMQYSSDDVSSLFTKKEFDYTDNIMFDSLLENNIESLGTYVSGDETRNYVSQAYYTKEEELSNAANYYDTIMNELADSDASESYSYSDSGSGFSYYLRLNSDEINFNTSTSKDDFLKKVAVSYDDEIVAASRRCANAQITAQNAAQNFVNLKYFIRDTVTGETWSNISENEINAMTDGWFVQYKASSGIVKSSDKNREISNNYYRYYNSSKALDSDFGDNNINITLALPATANLQEGDDYFNLSERCMSVKNNSTQFASAAGILLLAAFALSIYLVMVSGRTNTSETAQISWVDKIPTDIHFIISALLVITEISGAYVMAQSVWYALSKGTYEQTLSYIMIVCEAMLFAVFWATIIEWAMHISRYYKTKRPYFRNSVCGMILLFIIKILKEIVDAIKRVINVAPKKIKKRAFTLMGAYVVLNTICCLMLTGTNGGGTFFMLMVLAFINISMLSLMWKYLVALDEIAVAAEKGKNGELPEKIDSQNYPEPMKSIADNLYITQDEMKKAVDEAVKGERMKTELITNVSHDLKTPLTSIISYVDLLKKCDINDEKAQKFIGVLDEKSIRLKRLIDDLVEASKVSSGVVQFNKMNVNLNELAVQAIAEVEDSFKANDLEIVFNNSEDAPIIFVDSQKTWRVIDNLLSNARKYSLRGSRVYVEVGSKDNNGYFSVKNVSTQALNIDSEELTQRFVRGDASRSNEGSGLGLSIAKDLCSLQGGHLDIDIDGDLFKATINFPLIKLANDEKAEAQEEVPVADGESKASE